MWIALLSLVVCALTWVSLRWHRARRYWSARGVPHLSPHPIFGSLSFLIRSHMTTWLRDMHSRFPEQRYVGIWLFWRPALLVNDVELAKQVFITRNDIFRNRFVTASKKDLFGSLSLFAAKDPTWSRLRRGLAPVFTAVKLRNMQPLLSTKLQHLKQRLAKETEENEMMDLRDIISDYTTDVISTTAFGVEGDATSTGSSPMRTVTREFMEYSLVRAMAWCSIFFLPEALDIFGFTGFPKKSTDYLTKIFSEIIKIRSEYDTPTEQHKDLVDAMLSMKHNANLTGEDITDDVLLSQASIFLQAGFDTTGATISFLLYEIAYAPRVQDKLYEELFETKEKFENNDIDLDTLAELPYLNCVIKETLRKYPPMKWGDRVASETFTADEHLKVEAGTPVYVNIAGIHYDPKYYPEPEKFIPERFLPGNELSCLESLTYMPFGLGPRRCIGERFAMNTMRSVISGLLLSFRVCPVDKAPQPADLKLDPHALFTLPADKLSVRFESHKQKKVP